MARMGRDSAPERARRAEEQQRRLQEWQRQETERRQAQQQQNEQRQAAVYAFDTGIGRCPKCGSPNLTKFRRSESDSSAQSAACCVGCFLFWPVLLLMPFLQKGVTYVRCQSCGHQWPA